jgi:hypothetical protein
VSPGSKAGLSGRHRFRGRWPEDRLKPGPRC